MIVNWEFKWLWLPPKYYYSSTTNKSHSCDCYRFPIDETCCTFITKINQLIIFTEKNHCLFWESHGIYKFTVGKIPSYLISKQMVHTLTTVLKKVKYHSSNPTAYTMTGGYRITDWKVETNQVWAETIKLINRHNKWNKGIQFSQDIWSKLWWELWWHGVQTPLHWTALPEWGMHWTHYPSYSLAWQSSHYPC